MNIYWKAIQFANVYSFARSVKQTSNLAQKSEAVVEKLKEQTIAEKVEKIIPKKKKERQPFTISEDKKFQETPEFIMSSNYLKQQTLPEDVVRACRQVFAKYPVGELRQASNDYMRMYQLLHARERPNVINVKAKRPFENTDELTKYSGNENIIYLRNKAKKEEEILQQNQAKKDAKLKDRQQVIIPVDPVDTDKSLNRSTLIEYDHRAVVCNLLRKAPGSFAIGVKILAEIKRRFPLFKPKTHLDFGAGQIVQFQIYSVGPWSWAANQVYGCDHHISVEPNNWMRKLGRFIKKDDQRYQHIETLSHTVEIPIDQYDLVTIAFVLEEVTNPDVRLLILQSLWQKVALNGVMVLCSPGTPMGFRFVNDFRNMLREKAKILAPCPHNQQCPIVKEGYQWCHFEQNVTHWPKNVFPKEISDSNIINEKYSYIIFQKTVQEEKREELLEIPKPEAQLHEQSEKWGRIMFPTMKRGGHIILDMCSNEGQIERRVIGKSHGMAGGYYDLKQLKWGDLWRFPMWIPNKRRKTSGKGKRLW